MQCCASLFRLLYLNYNRLVLEFQLFALNLGVEDGLQSVDLPFPWIVAVTHLTIQMLDWCCTPFC